MQLVRSKVTDLQLSLPAQIHSHYTEPLPHNCLENKLSYPKLSSETNTETFHLFGGSGGGVMGRDEKS